MQAGLRLMLDPATEILRDVFGHPSFRPSQRAVIERLLEGAHALAIMPTGAGKSLCYQVPALVMARHRQHPVKRPLTVVLSPLIALMKDQVDSLSARSVEAVYINSSLRAQERRQRYQEIEEGRHDILYVTPERFRKPDFRQSLDTRQICLLAVDEAHCISQWGHDFRPDYTRVGEIREQLGSPPTVALTATATRQVQQDIVRQLGLSDTEMKIFHEGIERDNLSLNVVEVWGDDQKLEQIQGVLSRQQGTGIIYFTLIQTLERFSDRLLGISVPHLVYHGELSRDQRRRVQDEFLSDPLALVLATNAFGMGIDKPDIRFVVHADLPNSLESYYQEIGRAGRDGLESECRLLYDQADLATQMEFMQWSNPDADFYARLHDFLLHDLESINAFGLEWLRERLHAKRKHDRRLETALGMLSRYGAIEGSLAPLQIQSVSELPEALNDSVALKNKLDGDQRRLLSLVQYARTERDRHEFLFDYFMT